MATVAECEGALHTLAARLADADPKLRERNDFDRSLACRITDLDVVFTGHLHDGTLTDIGHRDSSTPGEKAQVTLRMSSDDLIALVDGSLSMTSAWTSGRVKIDASVLDLLKLRSVF